jgi:probable phosphoglycerate mutase
MKDRMEATRIILVRHGETDWNAAGRMQGQSDTPLNALGRAQAECVAQCLAHEPVGAIYSSDLARALETATIIGQALDLPVITSSRLRERRYGIWEGLTWSEIQTRYPEQMAERRARPLEFAPPRGETGGELLARALIELQCIGQRHPGAVVVVVTHGGLCYVLLNHILGGVNGDRREFTFGNASIHRLEVDGERWAVVSMNETVHLQSAKGRRAGDPPPTSRSS